MTPLRLEQERPDGCLSDLALERFLVEELGAGAERDAVARHLAACGRCRGRRDAFAAAPAHEPDQELWRRHAAPRPRRRVGLGAGLVAMAAAAAALVLVLRPKPAELDGTRTKGAAVALEIVARKADGRVVPVFEGAALRAGDAVRFLVTSPGPAHVAVLGLDEAGHVSIYAPAGPGAPDESAAGTHEVPGSVVLDATPGEERFVAVVCTAPIDRAALARAGREALTAAGGRPGRTGRLGLPCPQAGLSIRKDTGP